MGANLKYSIQPGLVTTRTPLSPSHTTLHAEYTYANTRDARVLGGALTSPGTVGLHVYSFIFIFYGWALAPLISPGTEGTHVYIMCGP